MEIDIKLWFLVHTHNWKPNITARKHLIWQNHLNTRVDNLLKLKLYHFGHTSYILGDNAPLLHPLTLQEWTVDYFAHFVLEKFRNGNSFIIVICGCL
jgi:hypothetical protein